MTNSIMMTNSRIMAYSNILTNSKIMINSKLSKLMMELELTEDWRIEEQLSRTKSWDYVDLGPKADLMIEYKVRS